MDQDELATRIQHYFKNHPEGVVAVYLFGSQARGDAQVASDVDVAVLFERPEGGTFAGHHLPLQWDLSGVLGMEVDVVQLNEASPDLVHRVLRDGLLLIDEDPSARIAFEVRKRAEYLDLLPYLRAYRRGVA